MKAIGGPVVGVGVGRRKDGFDAGRRAFFLDRLSEGAVVSAAAKACRISPTTAYNARARCPFFAAGWEAALELARQPLADSLYERAVLGVTSTYRRSDDGQEAEKAGHDIRLAMQVLARLDARSRFACQADVPWRALLARWDAYLDALAADDHAALAAMLTPTDADGVEWPVTLNSTLDPPALTALRAASRGGGDQHQLSPLSLANFPTARNDDELLDAAAQALHDARKDGAPRSLDEQAKG